MKFIGKHTLFSVASVFLLCVAADIHGESVNTCDTLSLTLNKLDGMKAVTVDLLALMLRD